MRRHCALLLALCLLLPALLPAQGVTTGSVAGRVTDTDGNPMLGVDVRIVHEPTGTKAATLTRSNGGFTFPSVKAGGPYTLTASLDGYKPGTVGNLFVKAGEATEVNIVLQKAPARARGLASYPRSIRRRHAGGVACVAAAAGRGGRVRARLAGYLR
jgi:hypothetical protein